MSETNAGRAIFPKLGQPAMAAMIMARISRMISPPSPARIISVSEYLPKYRLCGRLLLCCRTLWLIRVPPLAGILLRLHPGGRRIAKLVPSVRAARGFVAAGPTEVPNGDRVKAYVARYPSRSYTLNRLGDHFPRFLEHAAVADAHFLADVARLELAITEAFDAQRSEKLSGDVLRDLAPESWGLARLRPVASLRLLSLRYDV